MKYSVHSTEEEALAENERLKQLLGIPDGKGTLEYSVPREIEGKWCLLIKDYGIWKADHLAVNIEEI
jgi:hypothetical protein